MNDESVASEVNESESFIPVRKESSGDVGVKSAKKKNGKKKKLLAPKKSAKVSVLSAGKRAKSAKPAPKIQTRKASSTSSSLKTKRKNGRTALSVGSTPTRKGKVFYSGWKSRTHLRTAMAKDSALQCQRNSRTKIWKRDMISVGPGGEKMVTCGRCRMVIDNR